MPRTTKTRSRPRGPARRNIVIATVTAGAGHVQAATALSEAWRSLWPRDRITQLDVLDFTTKLYRKLYSESYLQLVRHAPELWAMVFKKTDRPDRMKKWSRVRKTVARLTLHPFVRHLQSLRPAAVLCTHFLPLELMGYFKTSKKSLPPPLTVSVVTDFEAHALWMDPAADLYCVAAPETQSGLVARGVDPALVMPTGIPVSLRFSKAPTLRQARKQAGLRDDLPVLLVLGGGFGVGPVEQILSELNKRKSTTQIVVVCGRNAELRRKLAILDMRHPLRLLGFVENMQDWLATADLVLTKPGGLTTSESLALGKPILVLNPIPGQEEANSDFLLEHGAAVKVNRVEDLTYRLDSLLGKQKLTALARAAARLGRPQAALDVCRETRKRLPG
jgi:processive 1,2-diacylglycerol beta-glucosyltransferase